MSDPTLPAKGELFAERYLVECGLGGGFESQVLGASDRETGRRVAIKIWTGEHAEQAVASARAFMRAAYECGLYEHPNLVEVFAAELQNGVGYCVGEWLEGSTLGRALQRARPASLQDVFEHVLPCMRAIAEAHTAGIVHGDIRPGHIFLCRATRHRPARPRVFDFGRGMPGFQELRAHKRPTLDEACHYTTPEQLQSAPLDARSDQYAFGVLIYEMLAGELPFSADNGNDLALEIVAGATRPLAELRHGLPPGLSDVVARAMAAEPEERYADLSTLIEALELFDPHYASVAPGAAPRHGYQPHPQNPAFVSTGSSPYDWSVPDSSEPRAVTIPAQAPARNYTFLPRAALAGAITAAVISAVYLDDGLFDRFAPQTQQSRDRQQHKPQAEATSYAPMQSAESGLAAPRRTPSPAEPPSVEPGREQRSDTARAPNKVEPAAGVAASGEAALAAYVSVELNGQQMPSAVSALPATARPPVLEPVQMPAGLFGAAQSTAAPPRALAAASGGPARAADRMQPPTSPDFPQPEVSQQSKAPARQAAAPQPVTQPAKLSEAAPAPRPAIPRRRKASATEAIQRLDNSLQLQ